MQNQVMGFIESIITEGWIIAVGVFVIGQIIKSSIPAIANKYIPLIGGVLGVALGVAIPNIFPGDAFLVCAIKGATIGWAATGAYEMLRNLKN